MAWAPDYITVQELAGYVRIPDNVDDSQLALAISAASRSVDRHCDRQFGLVAAPEVRFYTPSYDHNKCRWTISIDDLMTETGLVVHFDKEDDETYSEEIMAYVLRPRNAAPEGRPWTEMVFGKDVRLNDHNESVKVTAQFGWTTVPDAIKQATMLQANRIFTRRGAPFGVAGSNDMGSELRLLNKVDPDVEVILQDYVRRWGAV